MFPYFVLLVKVLDIVEDSVSQLHGGHIGRRPFRYDVFLQGIYNFLDHSVDPFLLVKFLRNEPLEQLRESGS